MGDRCYERFGTSAFVYRDASVGLLLRLKNVDQDDGHTYGDVHVFQDTHDGQGEVLLMRRPKVNLTSDLGLKRFRESADARLPWGGWAEMLEYVCASLMEEMDRKGEYGAMTELPERQLSKQTLFDDFCPAGSVTSLMAHGGTGKSMVAGAMALAVATGRTIGPFVPHRRGPVLWCDWENNRKDHERRIQRMCMGLGIDFPDNLYHYRPTHPLRKCESEIMEKIATDKHVFCVLDSIGPAAGGNLNDNDVATGAMNVLKHLGLTVLMIAHVTKASLDASVVTAAMPIGSGFFHNLAHESWSLRLDDEGSSRTRKVYGLSNEKENFGPGTDRPIGLLVQFEDRTPGCPPGPIRVSSYQVTGDMATGSRMKMPMRITDYLTAHPGALQVDAEDGLRLATAAEKSTFRSAWARLATRGDIASTVGPEAGARPRWSVALVDAGAGCVVCGEPVELFGPSGLPYCGQHFVGEK